MLMKKKMSKKFTEIKIKHLEKNERYKFSIESGSN